MKKRNRRIHRRIRLDRSIKVFVHIFSKMPFIGTPIEAVLSNISAGGMALLFKDRSVTEALRRLEKIRIHFRLPGHSLQQCEGIISHRFGGSDDKSLVGIRFLNLSKSFMNAIEQMANDNDSCDRRIEQTPHPWCLPTCSFLEMCCKPIRPLAPESMDRDHFEIAFQSHEQI